MEEQIQNLIKQLNRYYWAAWLVALLMVGAALITMRAYGVFTFEPGVRAGLQSLGVLFMLVSLPLGLKLFFEKEKKLKQLELNNEVLNQYKFWYVVRLLLVGGSVCMSIVLFVVTNDPTENNPSLLLCAAISLIGLMFCKQKLLKFVEEEEDTDYEDDFEGDNDFEEIEDSKNE